MELIKGLLNGNLILAIAIAILSWIAKNYFVAYLIKRDEASRKEWEFRLMNIWNPLFFWSGVALFDLSRKEKEDPKGSYGVKELSGILERSAHLIPKEHYAVFVKVLEHKTRQKAVALDLQRLSRARAFVYGQIETLNYLLYGRYPWFSPVRQSDPIGSLREFSRWIAELLWHLLVWGFISIILAAVLFAIAERALGAMMAIGGIVLLLLTLYMYWRLRAHRAITKRQELRKSK